MNAITNKNMEKGKLLAAVAVLAMVVCVFAVAIPSETSAAPVTPQESPFGDIEGMTYSNGVYTVSQNVNIVLDPEQEYGTAAAPLDIRFEITSGATLTFSTTSSEVVNVYIDYSAVGTGTDSAQNSVFYGGANDSDYGTVAVNGNVNLDLNINKDSTATNINYYHVIYNANIALTNGASMSISQTTGVGGTSWWCGSTENLCALTMAGNSTLTLDGSNGLSGVVADVDNSEISVSNPKSGKAFVNLADGSSITGSSITSVSTENNGLELYIGGGVDITDSEVDMGSSSIVVIGGATLDATGSTIDVTQFKYRGAGDAALVGGTVTGEFANDSGASPMFAVDGTTIAGESKISTPITVGENGVTVSEDASLEIGASVTGVIENEGKVTLGSSVTQDSIKNLTVRGGVIENSADAKMKISDGAEYTVVDKKYIATSFVTSDNYTIIIGINAVDYDPLKNYAGTKTSVQIDRYAIFGPDGTINNTGTEGAYTYRFLVTNAIYESPTEADKNSGEYGTVTDVGTYYMVMSIAYGFEGKDDSGTVEVIGQFKILPVEATVTITGTELIDPENPEKGYKIPDQTYTDGGVTLTVGDDFNFTVKVNGVTVSADSYDYKITYDGNDKAGNATVTVTVSGNYYGSDSETFVIEAKVVNIDAEIKEEAGANYIGDAVDKNDIDVTATYEDGTTAKVTEFTVDPETFMESGEQVAVTVTFTNADESTATDIVYFNVYGVEKIDITAEPTSATNAQPAGSTLAINGMSVTVTYEDGVTRSFSSNNTGTYLAYNGSDDKNFIFDSLTLNYAIGEEVPVEVTYFGASDVFYVEVTGYLINYVYYVDETLTQYATQAGSADETAVVYNFAMPSPVEGQSFTGWLVEGTSSTYLPGTQIEYGADSHLWGDDSTITLVAQFGDGQTTPIQPGETDPATEIYVGIVKNETGVVITLVGLTTDKEYGYIPAGSISISYTTVAWTAMGDVQIPMPQPPVTISKDVAQGQMIVKIPVDDFSGYDSIIGMNVSFSVDRDVIAQNSASYDIVLTAPTA